MFEDKIEAMNKLPNAVDDSSGFEKRVYTVEEIMDILSIGKNTAYATRLKKQWMALWRSQNRWSFHSENDSPLHPLLLSRCRAGCRGKSLISGLFPSLTTKTTEK